jgi:PTS system ascorbate-specific IIA component
MSNNLADALRTDSIVTQAEVSDWREALTVAGNALVAGHVTTDDYTAEMIATVDELGPYIVIAPGIALAHSRPSPAVLRAGISWVSLATPIAFGHPTNDPVSLVIGLAAVDHDSHLNTMSALAEILSDEDVLAELLAAQTPAEVLELLTGFGSGQEDSPRNPSLTN